MRPARGGSSAGTIVRKLDCHDRAALVAVAYETGLVTPGEPE